MVEAWILHFFMDIAWLLEWHHLKIPLVTCTTCILCRASWDTTHRIFDLDINLWYTSPYVIAWVVHLIHLSSCKWGMHSSFDDHLKLRITCGTIVLHDWYHMKMWYYLKEFSVWNHLLDLSIKTISWTFAIFMSTTYRISLMSWSRHHLWIWWNTWV